MPTELAVVYVVGGDKKHYDNLRRSLRSLERINKNIVVYIMDLNYVNNNVETTPLWSDEWHEVDETNTFPPQIIYQKEFDFNLKTQPHLVWLMKYYACLAVPEEIPYVFYLDSDTVVANDTIDHLIRETSGRFGITSHFWLPTVGDLIHKNFPNLDWPTFSTKLAQLDAKASDKFYAGGVFFYENNPANRQVLQDVISLHEQVYPDIQNSKPIYLMYDELMLSMVLRNRPKAVLCGALNHCSMNNMPLKLHGPNLELWGCNPFDDRFEPVTALHCDTFRRDPGKDYPEPLASAIREKFYL